MANGMPFSYAEWDAALSAIPDGATRRSVELLHAQALSYAWGAEDFGSGGRDSAEFANAYGIVAAQYATEKRFHRPPIQDAYAKWRKGEAF